MTFFFFFRWGDSRSFPGSPPVVVMSKRFIAHSYNKCFLEDPECRMQVPENNGSVEWWTGEAGERDGDNFQHERERERENPKGSRVYYVSILIRISIKIWERGAGVLWQRLEKDAIPGEAHMSTRRREEVWSLEILYGFFGGIQNNVDVRKDEEERTRWKSRIRRDMEMIPKFSGVWSFGLAVCIWFTCTRVSVNYLEHIRTRQDGVS